MRPPTSRGRAASAHGSGSGGARSSYKWVPNVGWRKDNTGAWISGTAYNYNDWTWISSSPDFRWTINTKGHYLVQGEVYWNVLRASQVYNVGHTTYRNGWWEDGSWCQF